MGDSLCASEPPQNELSAMLPRKASGEKRKAHFSLTVLLVYFMSRIFYLNRALEEPNIT